MQNLQIILLLTISYLSHRINCGVLIPGNGQSQMQFYQPQNNIQQVYGKNINQNQQFIPQNSYNGNFQQVYKQNTNQNLQNYNQNYQQNNMPKIYGNHFNPYQQNSQNSYNGNLQQVYYKNPQQYNPNFITNYQRKPFQNYYPNYIPNYQPKMYKNYYPKNTKILTKKPNKSKKLKKPKIPKKSKKKILKLSKKMKLQNNKSKNSKIPKKSKKKVVKLSKKMKVQVKKLKKVNNNIKKIKDLRKDYTQNYEQKQRKMSHQRENGISANYGNIKKPFSKQLKKYSKIRKFLLKKIKKNKNPLKNSTIKAKMQKKNSEFGGIKISINNQHQTYDKTKELNKKQNKKAVYYNEASDTENKNNSRQVKPLFSGQTNIYLIFLFGSVFMFFLALGLAFCCLKKKKPKLQPEDDEMDDDLRFVAMKNV